MTVCFRINKKIFVVYLFLLEHVCTAKLEWKTMRLFLKKKWELGNFLCVVCMGIFQDILKFFLIHIYARYFTKSLWVIRSETEFLSERILQLSIFEAQEGQSGKNLSDIQHLIIRYLISKGINPET